MSPLQEIISLLSSSQIAERGGLSADDRNVACFVSNRHLKNQQISSRVYATQIAPLVLMALGLDSWELQAVQQTGVQPLPGF